MKQVHVGDVGYTSPCSSTIELCLGIRRLLEEPLDGSHRTVQNSQRDTVVDNLEESGAGRGASDLVNNERAAMTRVDPGEVNGRDEVRCGSGFGAGFEVGEDIRRVNEEARDCGDAGVDEAFDSNLGIVELLHLFGSVIFSISGRRRSHGQSLSLFYCFCLRALE